MPEETIPQIKPNAEEEKPILDTIKINKPEKKAEKATSQMINKSPRKKIVFGVLGFLLIFIVILGLLFLNVYFL